MGSGDDGRKGETLICCWHPYAKISMTSKVGWDGWQILKRRLKCQFCGCAQVRIFMLKHMAQWMTIIVTTHVLIFTFLLCYHHRSDLNIDIANKWFSACIIWYEEWKSSDNMCQNGSNIKKVPCVNVLWIITSKKKS